MASIYKINKGIARVMIFKGIKGQYIGIFCLGLVLLLLLFAILYIARVNLYVLLVVVGVLGLGLYGLLSFLSKRFGEFGLMKFFAKRSIPRCLKFRSRSLFVSLNATPTIKVFKKEQSW